MYYLLEGGAIIMMMNLVIQKKRKELGLTQEQVAEYLNVSIPAVSKWEKGLTNPDISLLPSLARLLKIDLNTLFCFQEDISQQEIRILCQEITTITQTKGIVEGFEMAKQKIDEYPNNEVLLYYLTLQLDGLLSTFDISLDEMHKYDDIIVRWYTQLSKSNDSKISNNANYMMASKFIKKGDYDKAQEILDLMPDIEDILSSMSDKQMLQISIYQHQGKVDEATKDLQNALFIALNKVQILLYKMIDIELEANEMQTAKIIANKTSQMIKLFGLWEYNLFVPYLMIATTEKKVDECISILRKMLATMLVPYNINSSSLFHSISKTCNPKQMLPVILSEMEKSSNYDFLQNYDEFRELICEYKELIEK